MFRKIVKKNVLASLARHVDVTENFLLEINNIPAKILENVGNDLAKKAVKMAREVDDELHGHKAFLRLSVSSHGILHAKIDVKHDIEERIIEYYVDRFPTFTVLLESMRGVFAGQYGQPVVVARVSLAEALAEWENKLPVDPLLEMVDEGDYQQLWESFAKSQVIKGKKQSEKIIRLSNRWKEHKVTVVPPSSAKLATFFKNNDSQGN
ncbi:MAG: DUF4130 domain-containing protein [Candidatus Odinarchaeota archaeon]